MSKPKTKRGPMETLATEVSPGVWRFVAGLWTWEYYQGTNGLNLAVRPTGTPDSEFEGVLYAKNLDHAIMFAQGFDAGAGAIRRGVASAGVRSGVPGE